MLPIVQFYCNVNKSIRLLKVYKTIYMLEEYFCLNKLNLNANETDFITLSLKNDKRRNDLETVVVGSTIVKKSDHCKYLGVTIDKHLGFQAQVEEVLNKMAVGIKTVESVQHRFPTRVLLMLFHALVIDESPGIFSSVFRQN